MVDRVDSRLKRKSGWRQLLRFSLAVLGLICCARLITDAGSAGVSRLLSVSAGIHLSLASADVAVRLAPRDPQAHYARALVLINQERLGDAVAELREATRLCPYHYYEWLDLGVTLERLGDQTGAEAAIRESVRLAPFFDQPRWQLGSLLFRQGRYEEAFAQLRLGAKSNPSLVDGMLDLAWVASDGDVGTVVALVQPQSRQSHLQLATYLAKQGKGSDAVRQVREAGQPGDEVERALLHQTILRLLAAHLFSDAYAAWATTHHPAEPGAKGLGQILNGDFVDPITQNDPGFGWQVSDTPRVAVAIDPSGPAAGARSVRLEFSGANAPGNQLIHQLVLLQPGTQYSLSFMARTEDLVTGGPPVILALDEGGKAPKILGQSKPVSPGTSEWSAYEVDFTTDEDTVAVIIAVQRLGCSQSPCPIFGKLWLSRFYLVKN